MWGWQPALYLFLGGVGAGAFLAAGILVFMDRERHRTIAGASMWAAIACLGVGLLLLLSELTNPLRGLLLWKSFSNHTSWMAFGAWAALLALVFFAASALVVTRKTEVLIVKAWPAFAAREHAVVTACVSAGMVLAACVAVYTGMLLMAVPGVPYGTRCCCRACSWCRPATPAWRWSRCWRWCWSSASGSAARRSASSRRPSWRSCCWKAWCWRCSRRSCCRATWLTQLRWVRRLQRPPHPCSCW